MAKNHQQMRVANRISLFLGDIADEDELDEYVSEQFAADFGFEIDPDDGPEMSAQDEADVGDLLNGFSFWQHYVDAAVAAAKNAGIERACSAIIFFNFAYDPAMIRNQNAPFRFVGAVPFTAE